MSFHSLALMLRGRAALTQREFAASIGVSERAVQVWEAGLGYPSAASLQRLIALYVARHAFSSGNEMQEAAALWSAALAEAPRLKTAFDSEWFGRLLASQTESSLTAAHAPGSIWQPNSRDDWGDAPAVTAFHGRATERQTLSRWLAQDFCHVVGIFGMGRIGKTALAAHVAAEFAPRFDAVFWRSLRNAPPCADWLADAILFLSQQQSVPPDGEEARLRRLLELLRERRCLLVLDNLEAVLEPRVPQLSYREGYASFGLLLQSLGEASHQSCLMVTSREQPPELARLEGPGAPVRGLRLGGLDDAAGQALLADKGLVGSASTWGDLVRKYAGHALALQVVAELIARVFGGDIAAFLLTGEAVFGDIRRLLQSQMARLSMAERTVLYWLALEREPVDFSTLAADVGPRIPRCDVLDALQALDRRSLLEVGEGEATFTLQPVVLEHVTDEIIAIAVAEIELGEPMLLETHALVKAQTPDFVRRSQERLVAEPLLERLASSRSSDAVQRSLMELLERWRGLTDVDQGFGPGNVVNLMRLSRGDLRGLDLSRLVLRQTDLSMVDLQDASLAHARLEDAVLAQQQGAALSTALSADGAYLAVGTIAGEVRVWRLAERAPVLLEKQPSGPVWGIAIAAHGQLVASCGGPGAVWLWRPDGVPCSRLLTGDGHELWCVALSAIRAPRSAFTRSSVTTAVCAAWRSALMARSWQLVVPMERCACGTLPMARA